MEAEGKGLVRPSTMEDMVKWAMELKRETSDDQILYDAELWRRVYLSLSPFSPEIDDSAMKVRRRKNLSLSQRLAIAEAHSLRAAISAFFLAMSRHGLNAAGGTRKDWPEKEELELNHEITLLNVALSRMVVFATGL